MIKIENKPQIAPEYKSSNLFRAITAQEVKSYLISLIFAVFFEHHAAAELIVCLWVADVKARFNVE